MFLHRNSFKLKKKYNKWIQVSIYSFIFILTLDSRGIKMYSEEIGCVHTDFFSSCWKINFHGEKSLD